MPLTFTIKEVAAKGSASWNGFIVEATRVFIVQASEPTTSYQAGQAQSVGINVPNIGEAFPDASNIKCAEKNCDPVDETRLLFIITCKYTVNQWLPSPLDEETKFSYDRDQFEQAYTRDVNDAVSNMTTAGEVFAEPPKRRRSLLVINAAKNVAADADMSDYEDLSEVVNDANVTIEGRVYAAGTLFVASSSLSEVKEQNAIQFRILSSVLIVNPAGWNDRIENRGFYQRLTSSGSDLIPINFPGTATPVTYPWPIAENGTAQASAYDAPFIIEREPYESVSISALI